MNSKNKIIDDILNRKTKKKICLNCGCVQKHSLIFCHCGNKYEGDNLTNLDCFKLVKSINKNHGPYRIDYFYALHERILLKKHNITKTYFEKYLNSKLK